MRALVLHSLPPDSPCPGRRRDEFDLREAAENIATALEHAVVVGVHGHPREILTELERHQTDVVFNLCEAPLGRPDREAHVAALLEWLGVRFTGSGSETLALCRRKDLMDPVLRRAGVAVPDAIDSARPVFPCLVKPADEDGSAGLYRDSVCEDEADLARALARARGPVLVQRFFPGREFAVSLWGRARPDHHSIGETLFARGLRLNTYAAKWDTESDDFADSPMAYDSPVSPELREAIVGEARAAWHAVGARHTLRIDVRLDAAGAPHVLDVNPNPEISPGAGICRAVEEAGWSWEDFVSRLVEWA